MKTDQPKNPAAVFLQTVSLAVAQLKQRLRKDYEQAYPGLSEVIHLVLDEEEAKAWELTLFPHLLLPDLVDAHIANLNLQPAKTNRRDLFAPDRFRAIPSYKPAVALCA
ncbi:MAG TPA: hypothetical protein VHT01_08595 [Candidatus Udaeobacter sp.]|jgi:hypothetical protein|nr:hypothetical protein [Candidatus Udaeobacter sp.]